MGQGCDFQLHFLLFASQAHIWSPWLDKNHAAPRPQGCAHSVVWRRRSTPMGMLTACCCMRQGGQICAPNNSQCSASARQLASVQVPVEFPYRPAAEVGCRPVGRAIPNRHPLEFAITPAFCAVAPALGSSTALRLGTNRSAASDM